MSYELRILNGLHRGAAMPLTDESLSMGASENADIVLVDRGIERLLARLSRTENGWLVLAEDGGLYVPEGADPQKAVDIEPGAFVRVGLVWMTISKEDDPWVSPPPDPVPTLLEADEPVASVEESAVADEMATDEPALTEAETLQADERQASHSSPEGGVFRRLLAIPFIIVALLAGAGAYAITAKSPVAIEPKKLDMGFDMKVSNSGPDNQSAQDNSAEDKAGKGGKNGLTQEELRQAFRKRMSDADLLKRFDLSLKDDSWSMRGDLDPMETARFERVLKGFMAEYKVTFPVNAKVVPTEEMLPFRIMQVVSGSHASIVTNDGSRLYVGDEYQGIRVMSITGNKLVFAGKRKIEVVW